MSNPLTQNPLSPTYGKFRVRDYAGRIHAAYDPSVITGLLSPLIRSGFHASPVISRSDDREVFHLKMGTRDAYLKRYRFITTKQVIQTIFQVNKAQKAYRIGRILLKKGIRTPVPIAFLRRRMPRFGQEYLLLTEGIRGGVSLRNYVQMKLGPECANRRRYKKHLLKQVAEFLGRLHEAGIYHGDFTSDNIFVQDRSKIGDVLVYLIDLDSIRSTRWISARRRLKNLDELGRNFRDLRIITTADRAGFLKIYMETFSSEGRSFKTLFKAVLNRTRKRLKIHDQQWRR